MKSITLPLDVLRADSVALAGGKAASLGEMRAAGFPVPDAFVLTTESFDLFLRHARLAEAAASALGAGSSALEELRRRIVESPLAPELEDALVDGYRALAGDGPVAVRSSGVSEDGAGASFAGLYESVLHVAGKDALVDAVRRCFASAFSDRVLVYRKARGVAHGSMAVAIQRMVPAEASGVLFTVNPLTGREEESLVEAVKGYGDALVSGRAPADRWVATIDGVVRTRTPAGEGPMALDDALVAELVAMGAAVQEHYGRPMDVEWAVAGGGIALVQARPITALHFPPDVGEWTTADFKDGGVSSDVCCPFMWSLYEMALEHSMPRYFKDIKLLSPSHRGKWGRMFFARPYWNLAEVKKVVSRIPGYVERNFDTDLGIDIGYDGPGQTTPVTLAGIVRALPVLFALKRHYRLRLEENERFTRELPARMAPFDLESDALKALPDDELARRYRELVTGLYFDTETAYFTTIYNTSNSKLDFKVHFEKARAACGGDLSYLDLVSGLGNLSHMRPMKDLHATAGRLHRQGLAVDDGTVAAFARRWRQHGRRELDIRVPRWNDDLPFVRQMIEQAVASHASEHDPVAAEAAMRGGYERHRARALRGLRWRPLARRSFARGLRLVRRYAWWREEMRDHSSHLYALVRTWTVEAARRLHARGALPDPDHVWYLPYPDVLDLLDGKLEPAEAARRARAGLRMVRSFRHYRNPNEIRARDAGIYVAAAQASGAMRGTGCSPGRVRGPARVLRGLEEMQRVRPGDVLVAVFTDPGWTPLFGIAAAIVTETGGLLSHAALVSREYGIPAVLAVAGATTSIPDGALVDVDGSAGTVTLVDGGGA